MKEHKRMSEWIKRRRAVADEVERIMAEEEEDYWRKTKKTRIPRTVVWIVVAAAIILSFLLFGRL